MNTFELLTEDYFTSFSVKHFYYEDINLKYFEGGDIVNEFNKKVLYMDTVLIFNFPYVFSYSSAINFYTI